MSNYNMLHKYLSTYDRAIIKTDVVAHLLKILVSAEHSNQARSLVDLQINGKAAFPMQCHFGCDPEATIQLERLPETSSHAWMTAVTQNLLTSVLFLPGAKELAYSTKWLSSRTVHYETKNIPLQMNR